MENNKQPYYIFLDIDGTLWDAKFATSIHGYCYYNQTHPKLKQDSINALNVLLSSIENNFDSKLVITSRRRKNLQDCLNYLTENGLVYDKPIYATKVGNSSRGEKIVDYMVSEGMTPFTFPTLSNIVQKMLFNFKNNDFKNYVVLEDEKNLIKNQIPPARTIMANHDSRSLTTKQVVSYLKANKISAVFETRKEKE